MEKFCKVDVSFTFYGNYGMTDLCRAFNDDCGQIVCHDSYFSESEYPWRCAQHFEIHGQGVRVPDGMPCWHPSSKLEERGFDKSSTVDGGSSVTTV